MRPTDDHGKDAPQMQAIDSSKRHLHHHRPTLECAR